MSADTPLTKEPDASTNRPVDGSELIRFEQVTKRFGSNTVLDHLDFSVNSGKHVTLIGPSGSGKTTILRLLMTLTKPEEGTITVGGLQLFPAPRSRSARSARTSGWCSSSSTCSRT